MSMDGGLYERVLRLEKRLEEIEARWAGWSGAEVSLANIRTAIDAAAQSNGLKFELWAADVREVQRDPAVLR